ncbi:hypothetical protein UlMin_005947 [Ulmus minor]
MSKLGLLRTAVRSNFSVRTLPAKNHGFSAVVRDSPRRFSTESEQQPPPHDAAVDSFVRTQPTGGPVYGRFLPVSKHTLRTDVINMLEGCHLSMEDVKCDYNWNYFPTAMMVQFPSPLDYEKAFRALGRKGRQFRLERVEQSLWDVVKPYDGKTVLLQGFPRNATPMDVERFLSGCEYDSSSIQIFLRLNVKMATVRCPSEVQAFNCFLTKNKTFCMNNEVSVRVLQ